MGRRTSSFTFGSLLHRLLWKLIYNKFPDNFIDHIDRDKSNNRLNNLREATAEQNSHNVGIRKDNTTKYTGVSMDKRCGKYRAYINIDGKQKSLGYYTTAYEAHLVREAKAKELRGDFYSESTINC